MGIGKDSNRLSSNNVGSVMPRHPRIEFNKSLTLLLGTLSFIQLW